MIRVPVVMGTWASVHEITTGVGKGGVEPIEKRCGDNNSRSIPKVKQTNFFKVDGVWGDQERRISSDGHTHIPQRRDGRGTRLYTELHTLFHMVCTVLLQ
jgi:hypothetical protein